MSDQDTKEFEQIILLLDEEKRYLLTELVYQMAKEQPPRH